MKIKHADIYQTYELQIPKVGEKMKYGTAQKIVSDFLESEFDLVKLVFDPWKYPPASLVQSIRNVRYRKGLKNSFNVSYRGNNVYLFKGDAK